MINRSVPVDYVLDFHTNRCCCEQVVRQGTSTRHTLPVGFLVVSTHCAIHQTKTGHTIPPYFLRLLNSKYYGVLYCTVVSS